MPVLTLIAGPNGSDKSTLIQSAEFSGRERLLDVDAIARTLNPSNPAAAAILAGRELLKRIDDYFASAESFGGETTLSSRRNEVLLRRAKSLGYEIDLVFVGLDNSERCIARIRSRAAQGGYFIPDASVRRRYARSLVNGVKALRIADRAKVYDNSGDGHRLILIVRAGAIVWRAEPLPP